MAGTDDSQISAAAGIFDGAPVVVLVEPQLAENIGAAARAMLNFGLTELRMVRPRPKWPHPKSFELAAGAKDVLENAQLFDTTEQAVADIQHLFAATARQRDMIKPVFTPHDAAGEIRSQTSHGSKCGLLFGREASGLENDDLALSQSLIIIPANPARASLNLAQAVLLIGYEWFQAGAPDVAGDATRSDARPATQAEVTGMFKHLEGELDESGFFRAAERRPRMVRNIRNIFSRADLTDQEVRTLRGIIVALTGKPPGKPPGKP